MIPNWCLQDDGSILVTSVDPDATATADIYYVNGLPVNNLGQLQTSSGPIASYAMGFPFDADGKLVVQDWQEVSATDSFVGGVRVGTDGVYVDDWLDTGSDATDCFNGGIRCKLPDEVL